MNNTLKSVLLLLIVSSVNLTVQADVFTLWPFSEKESSANDSSASFDMLDSVLDAKPLWNEPVTINGQPLELGISLIRSPYAECLLKIKTLYPNAKALRSSGSSLYEVQHNDGTKERVYLVNAGGRFPVIQFTLTLSNSFPKVPDTNSYRDLPVPTSATAKTTMSFSKRQASFCEFVFPGPRKQAIADMKMSLFADGWLTIGQQNGINDGEFFYKDNPRQVIVFSVKDNKDGSSTGAVYKKALLK